MSKSGLGNNLEGTRSAFGVLLLAASLMTAFAPATALAQQQGAGDGGGSGIGTATRSGGWYSGLSVGRSQTDISDSELPVAGAATSNLFKNEWSTGYKL